MLTSGLKDTVMKIWRNVLSQDHFHLRLIFLFWLGVQYFFFIFEKLILYILVYIKIILLLGKVIRKSEFSAYVCFLTL
jgi:hypothetical protein